MEITFRSGSLAKIGNGDSVLIVDAELVTQIKERANDMEVALGFMYKTENYVELNEVVVELVCFKMSDWCGFGS